MSDYQPIGTPSPNWPTQLPGTTPTPGFFQHSYAPAAPTQPPPAQVPVTAPWSADPFAPGPGWRGGVNDPNGPQPLLTWPGGGAAHPLIDPATQGFIQRDDAAVAAKNAAAAPQSVDFDMADPFAGFNPATPVGQAIPGGESLNMLGPGAAEAYYTQHQQQFGAPTLSGKYAADTLGWYGNGNTPGVSNNAQGAYDQFQGQTPADMSSYYANAGRQATEGIDKAMAARGMYGSSGANDQISEALTNLAADRAKNEAQYGLSRAGTAGSLGSAADSSSRGASANEQSWMQGLGGIAAQGDTAGLSSLVAGQNASLGAQGAQTTRGQNMFNNQMGYGNAISGVEGQDYNNMFTGDQSLIQGMTNGLVGIGAEGVNQASQNSAQARSDATNSNNTINNGLNLANSAYQQATAPTPGSGTQTPGAGPMPGYQPMPTNITPGTYGSVFDKPRGTP